MSDLISREAALHAVNAYDDRDFTVEEVKLITNGCANELSKLPTIEAEPVRHGSWITVLESVGTCGTWIEEACSMCGCHTQRYITQPKNRFCPGCGAKMDGGIT